MNEKLVYLWGPLTAAGLIVAAIVAVVDQASKLWLLYVFDIGVKGYHTALRIRGVHVRHGQDRAFAARPPKRRSRWR